MLSTNIHSNDFPWLESYSRTIQSWKCFVKIQEMSNTVRTSSNHGSDTETNQLTTWTHYTCTLSVLPLFIWRTWLFQLGLSCCILGLLAVFRTPLPLRVLLEVCIFHLQMTSDTAHCSSHSPITFYLSTSNTFSCSIFYTIFNTDGTYFFAASSFCCRLVQRTAQWSQQNVFFTSVSICVSVFLCWVGR